MDNVPVELGGGDVGIVVALALLRGAAQRDGLLRTVLQAADALIAVAPPGRGARGGHADVARGADLGALAAAHAPGRVHQKVFGLQRNDRGPAPVLQPVEPVQRRAPPALPAGQNVFSDLFRGPLTALLGHGGRHGRQHHLVREQHDIAALMGHGGPVIQPYDVVDHPQAVAGIARELDHAEGVGVG